MTINTPNRALIETALDCYARAMWDANRHIGAADLDRLLDAARAEGPAQGVPGICGETGKPCGISPFEEAPACAGDCLGKPRSSDKAVAPPADEVGRADLKWLEGLKTPGVDHGLFYIAQQNTRIDRILSHVSRLEAEATKWAVRTALEASRAETAEASIVPSCTSCGDPSPHGDPCRGCIAEAALKLAVEALENIRDNCWNQGQPIHRDAHCYAREALSSIRSPIRGSEIGSLRHQEMPLAPGGDVEALEGLIEANKPFVAMLHALREDEGDSVTLLCDNPEGPPNNAIECNGGWTDWVDRRFGGETIEQAVRLAYLAKRSPINPPLAPTNMDTSGQSGGEG